MAARRTGVPDGLLLGGLALVVGGSASVWLATMIGGLLQRGGLPDVGYTDSVVAVRRLLVDPHNLAAAWPKTAPQTLPSPPVFYAALVLLLALFAGAALWVATWRLRRAARRRGGGAVRSALRPPEQRTARAEPSPVVSSAPAVDSAVAAVGPAPEVAAGVGAADPMALRAELSARAVLARAGRIRPDLGGGVRDPLAVGLALGSEVRSGQALFGALDDAFLVLGPPRSGKSSHVVIPAVRDAPGPVVVVAGSVEVFQATAARRATLGPVQVFDPLGVATGAVASGMAVASGVGGAAGAVTGDGGAARPRSVRWAPQRGCEDASTATARAAAMVGACERYGVVGEVSGVAEAARTVLRGYLHAAAVDGAGVDRVVFWAANPDDDEAVRVLRAAGWAADGWAAELADRFAAPAGERAEVWRMVRSALAPLQDARVLHECSPNRGDLLDVAAVVRDRGTLFVLAPGDDGPGLAPLAAAIVTDVLARCRAEARRQPFGRLAPPLLLALDDVAGAPLPDLPGALASGGTVGVTLLVALRSLADVAARGGTALAARLWQAASVRLILGAAEAAGPPEVTGDAVDRVRSAIRASARAGTSTASGAGSPGTGGSAGDVLPGGVAVVVHHRLAPAVTRLTPHWAAVRGDGLLARLGRRQTSSR